jgi:hypothetical protein
VRLAPYSCRVSVGVLLSVPLTGKNNSVGLRITWYDQFTVTHSASGGDREQNLRVPRRATECSSNGAAWRAGPNRASRTRVCDDACECPGYGTSAPWPSGTAVR